MQYTGKTDHINEQKWLEATLVHTPKLSAHVAESAIRKNGDHITFVTDNTNGVSSFLSQYGIKHEILMNDTVIKIDLTQPKLLEKLKIVFNAEAAPHFIGKHNPDGQEIVESDINRGKLDKHLLRFVVEAERTGAKPLQIDRILNNIKTLYKNTERQL